MLIRLRQIAREYTIGEYTVRALNGIDLEIDRGDFVAITGPSGSGKSTLLNLLGFLDRPTAGSYLFDNEEVAHFSPRKLALLRRHRIGFVFQSFHLVPRLSARDNVEIPMVFAGVGSRERRRRAEESLEAVGLSDRGHHRPDQLSGGQRQRVAIARALVMKPDVLLADEPTGNLDTATGHEILSLLKATQEKGLTLIAVTHNPEIAHEARRTIRLVDGKVSDGPA
jgi:putative ABC transport system ATP-binding protein